MTVKQAQHSGPSVSLCVSGTPLHHAQPLSTECMAYCALESGSSSAAQLTNVCMGAGGVEAGPRLNLPHGYIAQSASDLMLFTNPLVQDTLPPDWENR